MPGLAGVCGTEWSLAWPGIGIERDSSALLKLLLLRARAGAAAWMAAGGAANTAAADGTELSVDGAIGRLRSGRPASTRGTGGLAGDGGPDGLGLQATRHSVTRVKHIALVMRVSFKSAAPITLVGAL